MATPRPISEMRNCTTKLTSLNVLSRSTSRNVVRIETAAMSSGRKARNEANTKSSTASAPRRSQERLDQHAGALGVAPGGEQCVGRQAAVEPGCRGRLLEDRLHRDLGSHVGEALERLRVDQRIGRAVVVGQEQVVLGLGVSTIRVPAAPAGSGRTPA